jgi:ABC-2 type transport system ATP-binding protein
MEILKLNRVTKYFGEYKATNDVSFSHEKGKILGLLGPNGAGKTTIIRQITNIYVPDEGSIELFGELVTGESQNRIAYLPEERGLYKKVKVLDMLIYFGRLKGLSRMDAKKGAMKWLDKLGAADWIDKKVQDLSKGMSQKVQFIGTILHEPEFMILDEPFSGFDPVNAELLKNIILEFKAEGKTIILSTHVMHQVEQLCDDIVLINKGRVVLEGDLREVKRSFGKNHLIIEFQGDGSFFDKIANTEVINRSESRIELKIKSSEVAQEILKESIGKIEIHKFLLDEPSLDEIFIDTVGRANLDESAILEIGKK